MNLTPQFIIDASYFAAAFLFIYGLKRMSSPVTARSGIMVAGVGMLVAVLASFLYYFGVNDAALPHLGMNVGIAALALFLGTAWAWWSGKRVAMTAMPQMVALYNGMGGGAAACIAAVELLRASAVHQTIPLLLAVVGALIGAISLS
ncbi:MAG TPA: NAD(P)(+) transhydrogenase (Re/Si-specific) subunit beta, partial [Steroidobacter sp.]